VVQSFDLLWKRKKKMANYRNERFAILLQEAIGELIVNGKIKDPRVEPFLSVTRVEIGKSFDKADVYISSWKTEGGLKTGVLGLQTAAPYIQKELAKKLKTRLTPKLHFYADSASRESFDIIQKIDALGVKDGHNGK
jgi:ribosome-binding factor A